jgi:hypothetical protein
MSRQQQTAPADRAVTLTRPDRQSATFGPMPARDAAIVVLIAHVTGHGATVQQTS